jgi:hypothetical protein
MPKKSSFVSFREAQTANTAPTTLNQQLQQNQAVTDALKAKQQGGQTAPVKPTGAAALGQTPPTNDGVSPGGVKTFASKLSQRE